MRRIIAFILACVIFLAACSSTSKSLITEEERPTDNTSLENSTSSEKQANTKQINVIDQSADDRTVDNEVNIGRIEIINNGPDIPIKGMDDESLIGYVEDNIYLSLVNEFDSEDYFVENVEAVYYPKEYIEALSSNSQSNLYFGYTSDELNAQFEGTKYVFTLGENGQTIVVPMETVSDDVYIKAMEDVIVGSGVILVCVTVSVVAAPAAPAVSMIFAASATTGTTFALQSGTLAFAAAAITKGYETESFEEALRAGAEAGAEGFKWGAISGAIIGGVGKGAKLYGEAKQTGFTMNQYAKIQQETGYPLDVIKEFHNMEEYQVFKDAHLEPKMVGNKSALIKTDIDLNRVDAKGRTNLQRMKQGLAPQDSQGISYELHHVGQRKDGTLAILSRAEHDNPAIHGFLERSEAHAAGTNWDAERKAFWQAFAALVG